MTDIQSTPAKHYGDTEKTGTFQVEDAVFGGESKVSDYKADAIEAENAEHNMTVLEAVRQYPMASFWAFVMSFTIVSILPPLTYW